VRNGGDYVPERKAVSVEVALTSGTSMGGRLWIPAAKSLADALNGSQAFVEFSPYGDERTSFLAKAQIASVVANDIPKTVLLHERRGVKDADDPYHILAIAPGAPWYAVREAYLKLAKAYHPDRFAGVDLPTEVTEYLGVKARRINAAYALLERQLKRIAAATGKAAAAGR
jgi:hypothetical protein